jgi:hypothetical protein
VAPCGASRYITVSTDQCMDLQIVNAYQYSSDIRVHGPDIAGSSADSVVGECSLRCCASTSFPIVYIWIQDHEPRIPWLWFLY